MNNILIHFLLLSLSLTLCNSFPLSTKSRWIVDDRTGARVKLACVNWAGHLEPMLPEGLDKQPLDQIVNHISSIGFNCVRLTYAIHMYTRHASALVPDVLNNLGLRDALAGLTKNNPRFLRLAVVQAQQAVVQALARRGVMVVLDNHVSQPQWCCDNNDGNGFFGDKFFDPSEWLRGLKIAAALYRNTPEVVALSLRNELRGPNQNENAWYNFMQQGATTVHEANPHVLTIISGLNYDLTLGFLKKTPLNLNFKNKIVYEIHRYAFSGGSWFAMAPQSNDACGKFTEQFYSDGGFLTEGANAAPLFVSEFGVNQAQLGRADGAFLDCIVGYLGNTDLDWSLWAVQGSYYIRSGIRDYEETYGMLDRSWSSVRNPDVYRKLKRVMRKKYGLKNNDNDNNNNNQTGVLTGAMHGYNFTMN